MIPNKFGFLFGVAIMSIPWIICFILRKDLRREMLIMGILIAIWKCNNRISLWTVDWWRPETITGTIVGVEDFFLGFFNGGVAAVLYEVVSGEKQIVKKGKGKFSQLISFTLLCALIISFGTWLLGFTTFVASSIGMIVSVILLLVYRKDLLKNTLLSGLFMVLVSLPTYYIIEVFSPGWVRETFLYDYLTGIHILKAPLEDTIFYFLFGMWVGPFYELWKGEVKKK